MNFTAPYGWPAQQSPSAADFAPADEREVLEQLALATAESDPWTAAARLFIPEQRNGHVE